MKKMSLRIGAAAVCLGLGGWATGQSFDTVTSLRGAEVDEPVVLDQVHKLQEGRMQRNYRQQPPLIPHKIDQYQIDLRTNQCLTCHDWSKAGERGAPTLSMTHYLDRDGRELDHIAGTRYFCNQCHVPQAKPPATRAAVEHVFAHQKTRFGLFICTISLVRAAAKLTLAKIAANIRRLIFQERRRAMG